MSRADETSFGRHMKAKNPHGSIDFLISDEGYESLLAELDNPIWQLGDERTYVRMYYLTKVIEEMHTAVRIVALELREMLGDEEE